MKTRLADEIGVNSARVFGISVLSLLASGTVLGIVWGGRFIQPLEKPAQRVFLMALVTGGLSMGGILLADYISSKNESESNAQRHELSEIEEQDKKWEKLVEDLWGTEYCVASCKGCKHLVGEVASCTYMVCAMHPYGKQFCPDFERKRRSYKP